MSEPFWKLERFGDHLERWIDQEQPSPELRKVVLDWTFTLFDHPYTAGLRRDSDQPNFYWGGIPGSVYGEHQVVTCGFWIYEETRTVICYGYATLSLPCERRVSAGLTRVRNQQAVAITPRGPATISGQPRRRGLISASSRSARVLTEHAVPIAPSTYYEARSRPPSRRAVREQQLRTDVVSRLAVAALDNAVAAWPAAGADTARECHQCYTR